MQFWILAALVIAAAVLCIRFRRFGLLTALAGGVGWFGCVLTEVFFGIYNPGSGPGDILLPSDYVSPYAQLVQKLQPWYRFFSLVMVVGLLWAAIQEFRLLRRRMPEKQAR